MEPNTMEVKTPLNYLTLMLFEMAGTAIVTLAYCFGYRPPSNNFNYYQPDIVATGLFAAILLTKRVTGSHLNAGITLAVAIVEKANEDSHKLKIAGAYVLGQILGAFLGMLICLGIFTNRGLMDMSPYDRDTNIFFLILTEVIFSWIFLTIYMFAKNDWVTPTMDFGLRAFTMMGVQYLCSNLSLKITGGSVNPSIGFVAVLFRVMKPSPYRSDSNAIYMIPYLFGPLIAAVLSGLYLKYFAIKVTPPQPAQAGSPFLQRASIKKRIQNDASEDLSGSVLRVAERSSKPAMGEAERLFAPPQDNNI
jgi:glycerol uptake facilitator-like aquaporin